MPDHSWRRRIQYKERERCEESQIRFRSRHNNVVEEGATKKSIKQQSQVGVKGYD
jgi:hypothetical protein